MTKIELAEIIKGVLYARIIGTKYNNRKIVDISVAIHEEEFNDDEGYNLGCVDALEIKVKTETPKGKCSSWVRYYIY